MEPRLAPGYLAWVVHDGAETHVGVGGYPARFDPAHFFDGEVARYLQYVKGTRPAAGIEEVLVPGEPERRMKAERMQTGIPLTEDTWASISATARHVGLSDARIAEVRASG